MMAQRIKVLVVEDDDQLRKMYGDLLTGAGYLVRTATDGLNAVSHMERSRSVVVLTDFEMPHMTGLDLLKVLHARWPESLVIMHSGIMSEELSRQAMEAGAYACLTKQGDMGQLFKTIASALSTVQPPDQAATLSRNVLDS
jgi:DNA-binding NtrC family response regulator